MEAAGTPLPPETLDSIKRNGVALKGPITTPIGTGFRSVNVALRHELGLYACVRPCKTYPGVRSRYDAVDLVVVRENTEDLYAGIEFESGTDDAQRGDRVPERAAAEADPRRVRDLDQAAQPGGLRADHPLRLRVRARQRAPPRLVHHEGEHHEAHRRPLPRRLPRGREGLPGDRGVGDARRRALHGARPAARRSSTCSSCRTSTATSSATSPPGLVGGLGVAPGANIGTEAAVFEATHGSAPKYKGQNRVNPTAMILSGKLMLEHLGERDAARRLEAAVAGVIADGERVTYDLKPTRDDPTAVGTSEYADAIIERLALTRGRA